MKVVADLDEAIAHIEAYGSHHTDAIVTEDAAAAARFMNEVDSAIVLWNASTQFADGGEFGFGGEIGISTGRMHARGPVGAEQLCSFKYRVTRQRTDPTVTVAARLDPDAASLAPTELTRADVAMPLATPGMRIGPVRRLVQPAARGASARHGCRLAAAGA